MIEKDDGGSPTDDSGGDDSDDSDSGGEKEVSNYSIFLELNVHLHSIL